MAALTVHQMMRHPASSSTDDDDPGCLPGTGPINDTHLAPGCVPCATGGHADWDAADLIGDGGLVRAGLRGQRVDADLWDRVLGTDPVGQRKVDVPARGTAKLTLRCTPVDLLPPQNRKGAAPVRMIAVSALEENPPLHWMLLTTEGEAGLETARTSLRRYALRWRIERFFHALKVGTRIKDRRLDAAGDLKKCLAFDAITAFRVRDLTRLARERPDDPAERHGTREDITARGALTAHHGFSDPI